MACYHPINVRHKDKYNTVPCGKCLGCCLEYSRMWGIRCMHEAQMHKENVFLTLTYRDEELQYGVNKKTGLCKPTLYPRHLQLFWKRLREKTNARFRYFGCGEYGERYRRPHYHACLFGLDFKDKKLRTIKNGNNLYTSDTLNDVWSHGDCRIGNVTFESASYVARYIIGRKLSNGVESYEEEGLEPEFVRMSRRPGIGRTWLEKYSGDVFNKGYLVSRGVKCAPPRYYKLLFRENEPEVMENRARESMDKLFDNADRNSSQRLRVAEIVKKAQIKGLTRELL